jgi:Transposase DDE domain
MLSQQSTDFFDDLKTLFKNSSGLTSLIFTQIQACSFRRLRQDVQVVYHRQSIVRLLVLLKTANISSVNQCMHADISRLLPFCKDVLYKVKNSYKINWRSILMRQAYTCMDGVEIEKSKDASSQACFILDDTDLPKKGKAIELIGRIFSHVTGSYNLGFKSMNLAFWSGKHLLHLDFSLHIEAGKKKDQGMKKKELANRFSKLREISSPGHKRACEAFEKKTQSAMRMMRRAIAKGFKASYILADSWFFSVALARFALRKKISLITRPKFNNWKYEYDGRFCTIGQLSKKMRYHKSRKWNNKLRLYHVSVEVMFKGIPMKLFFFKEKKRGTPWRAIISTDKKLGAIQAYKIYQNRWSIEVSFKELKQLMRYGKCQSTNFDAQISDLTFCLMAYNHLSQIKAINEYQSIGLLFREISQNQISPNLMQRFWTQLYTAMQQLANLIDKNVDALLENIVENSAFFKELRQISINLGTET